MPNREVGKTLGPLGTSALYGVLLIVPTGLVGAAIVHPMPWWVVAPGLIFASYAYIRFERHWRRLKRERQNDTICTFARALPARSHDTWIARAVYEELSSDLHVSIRPHDRLEEDLGFLPEDLEDCIAQIARRTGRSLTHTEGNPLYDKVTTVEDLVRFLEHQRREQVITDSVRPDGED